MTKRRVQGGVATSERRRRDGVYQKSSKDFPSLENLPASSRFALCKQPSPSGANRASEPSSYSIVTATGSKRSSADSDLLLCHVRLWRASRLKSWQKFECEHSEMGFVLIVPSAHILNPRPLALSRRRRPRSLRESVNSHLYMRACRQCVHESARLSRVICSLAWYR